jgi:hypothetical protein
VEDVARVTTKFPRNQAAIAGVGATEFTKHSGASVFSLAARAVKAAVADAGLKVKDIDGLATFGPNDSVAPNLLGPALDLKSMSWYVDQFLGGSVSMSMLDQAALAVSAGVAECVVCYCALLGRSGARIDDGVPFGGLESGEGGPVVASPQVLRNGW